MDQEPSMGKLIRRARERKRWTQQQLADALGVGLRTVNDWENDRSYPRNSIGALEHVLGVRLDAPPPPPRLPPLLLRELERLTADERAYVIELLRARAEDDDEPGAARPG